MLKYRRIKNTDTIQRYEFYPEGNIFAPGIVEFEKGQDARLIQQSADDVKMFYATHALNDIDITRETGVVAWY